MPSELHVEMTAFIKRKEWFDPNTGLGFIKNDGTVMLNNPKVDYYWWTCFCIEPIPYKGAYAF